ncbi:MAG: DUF3494 domain-containing protein [Myxococcales bacterium]|nr:MAG: DUF3494 domain-containing protein [Myxococcales bacterium]
MKIHFHKAARLGELVVSAIFNKAAARVLPDRENEAKKRGERVMRSLQIGILFLLLTQLFACGQVVGWPSADRTAPTVSSTTPVNSATGVAFNASISATFSEAMDPLTITPATFTLLDGTTPVSGAVSYVGVTATFDPTDNLDPDTTYTARIGNTVTDQAGNAMAVDYVWSFTTGTTQDATPPRVSSTTPVNNATDVAFNAPIAATFSEAMDPLTITTATFTLLDGTTPVPGAVIYVGVTAIFTPTISLHSSTLYTATITSGVKDLAGNAMVEDYVWSFTTGTIPDTTPPRVSSTTPLNNATDVAFNAPIAATFSEAMNPLTISTATFTLLDGTIPVSGAVIYVGVTAIFTPIINLNPNTLYTATITSGVTDLAGNAMVEDYVWSFTTGTAPDTTPPRVSSTTPVNGATAVAFNTSISATFSEAMNPLTITTATFTLLDGPTPVSGTVSYVGVTATFDPTDNLDPDTTYTARIGNTVTDQAGNAMTVDYVWSFTTGTAPDTTPPRVSSTTPANGEVAVAFNAHITATFSKVMNPLTITTATFTLLDGPTPVLGAVTYIGVTAIFTPTTSLDPDTQYTATIASTVTDLAGNAMVEDYVWTFTTGPVPDTQRPSVTFTVPTDDATGAATDGNITAVFSEAMNPLTITTVNFTVQQGDTPVAGAVTYANVTATFNPTSALAANTTYSATITTAARDLAGNSLVRNFVWNFRTGATSDTTRPTVISTIPGDEATDVVLDTNVSATFNEAMDSLTLTTATFTLFDGTTPIEGTVTQTGNTVIFNPASDLDSDTEYTAAITNEATDLAGNALAENYVWSFTTGTALDPIAPTVILTNPDDLATDVPVDATVNATFSEAMGPLTITTATFKVAGPDATEVMGTVFYDMPSMIGAFTPEDDLLPDTTYTATITIGAMDLAGSALEADYVWSFSTGATPSGLMPVDLGTLSTFVAVAGAGLTNSNSSGATTLNGDVGLSPTATCLGDGSPCTLTNPVINGTLYANDPEGVAAQAKVDLTAAYVDATSRPVGTTVNDVSGMVLLPGVYTSDSTMSIAVGGTVTLDGQGDANAVWIFQIGSSLTVNNDAQVLLINGAKAKNVFWAIFASSTLGSNVSFQGSVLAGAANSVGTDSVVVGRLLCTTGQITLLSNTITLPPL